MSAIADIVRVQGVPVDLPYRLAHPRDDSQKASHLVWYTMRQQVAPGTALEMNNGRKGYIITGSLRDVVRLLWPAISDAQIALSGTTISNRLARYGNLIVMEGARVYGRGSTKVDGTYWVADEFEDNGVVRRVPVTHAPEPAMVHQDAEKPAPIYETTPEPVPEPVIVPTPERQTLAYRITRCLVLLDLVGANGVSWPTATKMIREELEAMLNER